MTSKPRISKLRLRRRFLFAEALEDRRLLAGPYAPAAGEIGSTAVSKDDSSLIAWASGIADYSVGSDVDAEFQTPDKALGPAEGTFGDVVSLGRGGEITLTFERPIRDGIGPDFAVFENALNDSFLELGYVEVSSDGTHFVRFENDSLTASAVGAFGEVDPTEISQLAGKYRQGFGTPFDLQDLASDPLLDITRVTHVRVIDVVGDGSQTDSSGDPIFDPFPTVSSAGFDLDAVGVLHQVEFTRDVVDLEDVGLGLAAESAFFGPVPDGEEVNGPFDDTVVVGSFTSGSLSLNNAYSVDFQSWNGWAYSNQTNTTTPGFMNQFSSFAGSGADDSATFAIAFPDQSDFFGPSTVTRDANDTRLFESLMVTNTTYAALSMRDGDQFAKKFGGPSGDDPDFLLLTITGKDAGGGTIGTVDFYLADYRFDDNTLDYIVDTWTEVDLSPIAQAKSLELTIDSSDVGPFGVNTPAYVAVDNIQLYQPELQVDVAEREIRESAGATTVRISRPSSDTAGDIVVDLASVDPATAVVPDSVTILDGQPFIDFFVEPVNNDVFDGPRQVAIDASASGLASGRAVLTIQDDEQRRLDLSIDPSSLVEGNVRTATIIRNDADLNAPLSVRIEVDDASLLSFDSVVEIESGQASTTFTITAIEDNTDRSDADVLLTASSAGYLESTASLLVIDNDVPMVSIEASGNYSESDASPMAGFEELGRRLAPEFFYNGADQAGGFTSGELTFNNDFNPTFGSWAGWSYSNTTDSDTAGFTNQYSAFPGVGSVDSDTYAVAAAFGGSLVPTITRDPATSGSFQSINITNTTYAALSMMQGDDFAKKFGGDDGNDPDFFLLTIEGIDAGQASVGTVEFYLADFRFADNAQDYIVDDWTAVDVSSLNEAVELRFSLSSSDVGMFGMNTPAYFAIDNLVLSRPDPTPTVSVRRNTEDTSTSLPVSLTSTANDVIRVPLTVTIPAGRDQIEAPLQILDDAVVDGRQSATLTATAAGHGSSSINVTVDDNEQPELTLSVMTPVIDEANGQGQAILHRNVADTTNPLSVTVVASVPDQLAIDTPIIIPAGSRSVSFTFAARDNALVDENRMVSLNATANGFASDQGEVTIVNDDMPPPVLTLQFDQSSLSESDAPINASLEGLGAILADESFDNGSDFAGGFSTGGLQWNNTFDPTFGSWGGWSISNTTDTLTAGFLNQYSAITGGGAGDSPTYAVANTFAGGTVPTISLVDPDSGSGFQSLMITNTTYAALSMTQGDAFAKKFGGPTGDDPDFFLLTIEGLDNAGQSVGSVDFYLADFRFADNQQDFIVDQWTWVDVSGLAGATSLQFALSSSDVGMFGMNTPAYFAVDQVILGDPTTTATATVSRSDDDLSEPLLIQLNGHDATEVAFPNTVEIPEGADSITFDVRAVDDFVNDGDQTAVITATAPSHVSSSASFTIEDDDEASLTLSLSKDVVSESAGMEAARLLVHRNSEDKSQPLSIRLSEFDVDITLPDSVTIPAGRMSQEIDLGVVDNLVLEGDRLYQIEVTADGFIGSSVEFTVTDDEVAGIEVLESDGATIVDELVQADEFQISLASEPLSEVFVEVQFASDDVRIEPVRLMFSPETWDQQKTVTVYGVPDLLDETDEVLELTLSVDPGSSSPLYADAPSAMLNVTVVDHQPTQLRLSEDDVSLFLIDESSNVRISEGALDEGIAVLANDRVQNITIESFSPLSGPVEVDAAGGDDSVTLLGSQFASIHGGEGFDRLVLNLDLAFELSDLINGRVFDFEEFVVASQTQTQLMIDLQEIRSIVSDDESLLLRVEADQKLTWVGDGTLAAPVMVNDEFAQVIQTSDAEVQVISSTPWQNSLSRWDVNQIDGISALDALIVINQLGRVTDSKLPPLTAVEQFPGDYYDVNGDGDVTAVDALHVINEVARRNVSSEAERPEPVASLRGIDVAGRDPGDAERQADDLLSPVPVTLRAPIANLSAPSLLPEDIVLADSTWLPQRSAEGAEAAADQLSLEKLELRAFLD